jgi:sugar phosphate isomerase/epimerase
MTRTPLAVQLYSLREEIKTDLPGVIRQIAETGYAGVEPWAGIDAATVAGLCRQQGLKITSAHLPIPLGDAAATTFAAAETLGITRVIVPFLPPERFTSADSVKQVAEDLNAAARACAARGFELGYHNHDFEFVRLGNGTAYDLLLELLDPTVLLEIDAYWVQTAGSDPAALIQRLGRRAPLIHVKDGPAIRGQPMTAVGDGVIDYAKLLAVAKADWFIVELDACATDMMTAIVRSYQTLTGEAFANV